MKLNRISLNTIGLNRIGLNRIGSPSRGSSSGSVRPYIDPEVLASLVAVCICDGKSNNDPDRAVIKNLVDPDNPFVISNAAYKLNSGFGKYEISFKEGYRYNNSVVKDITDESFNFDTKIIIALLYKNIKVGESNDEPSYKIKVSNLSGKLRYYYINDKGSRVYIEFTSNGEYTLPISYDSLSIENTWIGFSSYSASSGTITQIPSFQGALVTDGVDDLIVSSKTVQEMLGGSNEITVVSMITHLSGAGKYNIIGSRGRIQVSDYSNQTFIAGQSLKNNKSNIIIELGDKNKITKYDYESFNGKFSVVSLESGLEISSAAWCWTFIAKRALTTDKINQVIAYYNLDKYVKPDIYYDVKKQGLSNNTPDADWYLKDFSGNGRDMQLYNYGKTPESGINEEGGLQSDGITDYGKAENLPIYKDYTVVADREIVDGLINNADGGVATRGTSFNNGAFCFDFQNSVFSFGSGTSKEIDIKRFISYQSKYINNGLTISAGDIIDTNPLCIARLGSTTNRYSKLALWSFLFFPYSLSEFLLERQLKRYKLGTLYPDMVEFRPIVKSNVEYNKIVFHSSENKELQVGNYYPIGSQITIYIRLSSITDEVKEIIINGVPASLVSVSSDNVYQYRANLNSKSPQKIDITIDEYIRYEDIVQPYPAIVNLRQNGKTITWGDKLKVGSEVTFVNHTNLLPELYTIGGGVQYNGTSITWNTPIRVEKSMMFTNIHSYKKDNEPNCILSPQTLRIPNASYKILGYIPDLTGKGNHGVFNNFAFTEESGVNEDGSIHFDGVDDFVTIPTLSHGAKQVLMKVRSFKPVCTIYEQRTPTGVDGDWIPTFCIFMNNQAIAYVDGNNGNTYIDGILNTSIQGKQLVDITHNITVTNENTKFGNTQSPLIGKLATSNTLYAQMALFTFMSFDDISSEEEIKELNDIVGIEGGYVESPDYYWDAYGKTNRATQDIDYLDLNQASNANQVLIDKSKAGLAALELYHNTGNVTELINRRLNANNFAFNEESGYGGISSIYKFATEPVSGQWQYYANRVSFEVLNDGDAVRITEARTTVALFYIGNPNKKAYYKITGVSTGKGIKFGNDNSSTSVWSKVVEEDGVYEIDWSSNINADGTRIAACIMTNNWTGECDIVIEQVAQYQNGLVSDGVDDHLINTIIPAFTDFTVIAKRMWINKDEPLNECFIHKGVVNTPISQSAFMLEYEITDDTYYRSASFGGYINVERVNRPESITYQTTKSYNGTPIIEGSGIDTQGLVIGAVTNNYWKGVFYKMMLYSKTIDQLSINMLKNLFERDELIDLTNPIFKKDEL